MTPPGSPGGAASAGPGGSSRPLQPPFAGLQERLRASARAVLAVVAPSLCAACDEPRSGLGGSGVCAACWASVQELSPSDCCLRCGLPGAGDPCRDCQAADRSGWSLRRAAAATSYSGRAARIVRAFKFRGFDLLAPALGHRMAWAAERFQLAGPSAGLLAVVPIPSTRHRNRERGFDPAELLASELARTWRLPVSRLVVRSRQTLPQSTLPASARRANVEGAFTARRVNGGSFLLVDDVVTTGATASAAATALLSAGAFSVDLLAFARTPAHEPVLPDRLQEPS